MKENDVEAISTQFGITKEIVEASEKDGTLGTRIQDALKEKVIYDKAGFETFKKNHAAEVTNAFFNDLVEKAHKGDIPTELYKPIKGSSLQQLEREISTEHDIKDFKDIKDLIGKVAKKTTANGKAHPELEKEINDLKEANKTLLKEKEDAVKTVEGEYKMKFLNKEKESVLSQIPFDFTDVKADELAVKKQKTQTLLKSVFDAEYKLDFDSKNRLVVMKGNDVLKNPATLEPLPATDVMINLAKEYNLKLTSPDPGGQGGKTSGQTTSEQMTPDQFYAYCKANGIDSASKEGQKIWKERGIK